AHLHSRRTHSIRRRLRHRTPRHEGQPSHPLRTRLPHRPRSPAPSPPSPGRARTPHQLAPPPPSHHRRPAHRKISPRPDDQLALHFLLVIPPRRLRPRRKNPRHQTRSHHRRRQTHQLRRFH